MAQQRMLLGHVKGDQGEPGRNGENGKNGIDAKVTSATGTVTPGHLDEPTVSIEFGGEPGAQTATFTFAGLQGKDGEAGPKGDAGAPGKDGAAGAAGKDADIVAVNVTIEPGHSGAPTGSASVSGEPGAKTIDITLTGIQGADGATGAAGPAGAAGHTPVLLSGTAVTGTSDTTSAAVFGAVLGDMYLNTDTGNLYGYLGSTNWHYAGCVKGPKGDDGKGFEPTGSSTDLVLGDGTTKPIATLITENIEAIRSALGLATTEHMGLVPQLPAE